jgi:hypothetical protein
MADKKKSVIRLVVPTGAKLSEVTGNVNLLATLLSSFLIVALSEQPSLRQSLLDFLAGYRDRLPTTDRKVVADAIAFIERI